MSRHIELMALLTELNQQIVKAEAEQRGEQLLVELRKKHAIAKEELGQYLNAEHNA